MMRRCVAVLLVLSLTCICACRRKADAPPLPFADFMQRADALLENKNISACVSHLECGIVNPAYAEHASRIFNHLLRIRLENGLIKEAEQQMVDALRNKLTDAYPSLGAVYQFHTYNGNAEQAQAWTTRLLSLPLPEGSEPMVHSWHLTASMEAGGIEAALSHVPVTITKLDEKASHRVLNMFLGFLVRQKKIDEAAQLLDAVGAAAGDSELLRSLPDTGKVSILVAQAKWTEAEAALREITQRLPDAILCDAVRQTTHALIRARAWTTADHLCEFLLTHPDRPTCQLTAATTWLRVAQEQQQHADLLRRINHLLDLKLPAQTTVAPFARSAFYEVMVQDNTDLRSRMLKTIERLLPLATRKQDRELFDVYLVDGYFIVGDYDRSLLAIKEGVEGKDEAWHEMARTKVSAHKALAENRIEDAITLYREFMGVIRNQEEPERDPTTDIEHSTEMTLGYNAIRIGDLYASINKAAEAEKAYVEAREYYNRALERVNPDSKEADLIHEQLLRIKDK